MPRFSLTRGKFRSIFEYALIVIAAFAVVPIFFNSQMEFSFRFKNLFEKSIIQLEYEQNQNFRKDLTAAVRDAFLNYDKFCRNSDEINSETGECIDNMGFSATLLESVETLYLLGLDNLYYTAYHQIKSDFHCRKLSYVNRRELWTRGVGSLIGAYTITGEKMFLEKAEECGKELLKFERKNDPYVNIQTGEMKKRTMENGVELSDLTAGFPELYAIYKYTGNETYLSTLKRKVQKLPSAKSGLYTLVDSKTLDNNTADLTIGYKTADFFFDLSLLAKMSNIKVFRSAISGFDEVVHLDPNSFDQYEMLNAERYSGMKFDGSDELFQSGKKKFTPPFASFTPGYPFEMVPFAFDGTFLRTLYDRGYKGNIETVVAASLESCKDKFGYSGTSKSSKNRAHFTHVQHASFLGEWTKMGALSTIVKPNFNHAFINSRGHILYLEK